MTTYNLLDKVKTLTCDYLNDSYMYMYICTTGILQNDD